MARRGWLIRLPGEATDRFVVEGFPDIAGHPREEGAWRLLPAVLRPPKVLCLMRSYRAHAAEQGFAPPPEPMFFSKLTSALLADGGEIGIPGDLEGEVHHEGELALVLGRGGRHLTAAEARGAVAAYTIGNDITARTMQKADARRGWPWTRGKGLDTFLPLGPGLVPAAAIPDPHDLELTVRVNGRVRQQSNTASLLWRIDEILMHLSRYVRLDPGDVVLTGTPEGVGPLVPGDEVEVEVSGIGCLRNSVGSAANIHS